MAKVGKDFRERKGLHVDVHKTGASGTTNNGNTARGSNN